MGFKLGDTWYAASLDVMINQTNAHGIKLGDRECLNLSRRVGVTFMRNVRDVNSSIMAGK